MRTRIFLAFATAIVVAACGALGYWQLSRLSERTSANTIRLARASQPPVDLASAALQGGRDDPLAYRRAAAEGEYDTQREIVLRARSYRGRAGNHVLTPLRLPGGKAMLVDRGWIPIELNQPPVAQAAPPARARVRGVLAPAEAKVAITGGEKAGPLRRIGRIDLARIAAQLPYPIEPLYLALESQEPAQTELPVATGLPAPGRGPHLSYAVQWFIFGLIAAVTGVLLMRRERKPAPRGVTLDSQSGGG